MEKIADRYGFKLGPDDDIIGLSYLHGKHCFARGAYGWAEYFWNITYDLTHDDEVRKKLDEVRLHLN